MASVWLACLFVRTEQCVNARSKLTEVVLGMSEEQREQLHSYLDALVPVVLPELLQQLSALRDHLTKLEQDVGLQEVRV